MMQMQSMEASLDNELLGGEEVLWSGRPDPRKRAAISPNRIFLILGACFLPGGIFFIALGLILSYVTVSTFLFLVFFIVGGVFTLLGVVYLLVGSLLRYSPSGKEFYAITNRRVIIVRSGRFTITSSYDRKAITQIHRIERGDESGDLIFSGTTTRGYGYSQSNAGTNVGGISRSGAFYGIPNVRFVEKMLLNNN